MAPRIPDYTPPFGPVARLSEAEPDDIIMSDAASPLGPQARPVSPSAYLSDEYAGDESVQPLAFNPAHARLPVISINMPVLPKVLWTEIAGWAGREAALTLRSVSRAVSAGAERAVSSLTLSKPEDVQAFLDHNRFTNIKHLAIRNCTDIILQALTRALHGRAYPSLDLFIVSSEAPWKAEELSADGLRGLGGLLLKSVTVQKNVSFRAADAIALAGAEYPVSLDVGLWGSVEDIATQLDAIGHIPYLTSFKVGGCAISDEMAALFGAHPRLTSLFFGEGATISTAGIASLAASQTLVKLDASALTQQIGIAAFQALAANRSLTYLAVALPEMPQGLQPSHVLSTNRTLTTLRICAGAHFAPLAAMVGIEHLSLFGWYTLIAREDAVALTSNPRLKTLCFERATRFMGNALAMIAGSGIETLAFKGTKFETADVNALMANRTLRSLRFEDSQRTISDSIGLAGTLARHPTLERLHLILQVRVLQGQRAHFDEAEYSRLLTAAVNQMRADWTAGGRTGATLTLEVFISHRPWKGNVLINQ